MKKLLIIVPACMCAFAFVSCQKDTNLPLSTSDTTTSKADTAKYTTVALTGDQLALTPSVSDSANMVWLKMAATTTNSYNCLNNRLVATISSDTLNFTGVAVPTSAYCTGGQAKAAATIMLGTTTDGTHNFIVKFNNVQYKGTYIKSGGSYTFTWPYSNGITISPLVVGH